jgi:hypothetical protein
MKNNALISLLVYFSALFTPLTGSSAQPDNPEPSVRTFVNREMKWVNKGLVVSYRLDAPFLPYGLVSYYIKDEHSGWQLSGSLTAISKVIRTEGPKIDITFMEKEFVSFLVDALGQDSTRILDADFADTCKKSKSLSDQKKKTVEAVCHDPSASIDGDSWSLSFPVANADSSASIWKFEGSVDVFNIKSWTVTTIKQEAAIPGGKDLDIY